MNTGVLRELESYALPRNALPLLSTKIPQIPLLFKKEKTECYRKTMFSITRWIPVRSPRPRPLKNCPVKHIYK